MQHRSAVFSCGQPCGTDKLPLRVRWASPLVGRKSVQTEFREFYLSMVHPHAFMDTYSRHNCVCRLVVTAAKGLRQPQQCTINSRAKGICTCIGSFMPAFPSDRLNPLPRPLLLADPLHLHPSRHRLGVSPSSPPQPPPPPLQRLLPLQWPPPAVSPQKKALLSTGRGRVVIAFSGCLRHLADN